MKAADIKVKNIENKASDARKSKAADKEKIRKLLESKEDELEAAAGRLAPGFDYALEGAMLEAGDQRACEIEAQREAARRKIAELLEAEYERLQAEAERIAPDFDYEGEALALEAEDEADIYEAGQRAVSAVTDAADAAADESGAGDESEEAGPGDDDALAETEDDSTGEADAAAEESGAGDESGDEEVSAGAEPGRKDEGAAYADDPASMAGADEKRTGPSEADFEWKEDKEAAEAERRREEEEQKRRERIVEMMAKPLPPAEVSPSRYIKARRKPATWLGRKVLASRHSITLAAAVCMLAVFAAYQAWDYLVPKTVNISYVTFKGSEPVEYQTRARSVGDMMTELIGGETWSDDVEITEHDLRDMPDECPVDNGLSVTITHAAGVRAKIAGSKKKLWLVPGTVEYNLALNEVEYDDDDEISPALNKKVSAGTKIVVDEVHYDIKDKKETIESVSKVILDPSLTSGVQVQTEGNDGEGVFTYTTRYVNGRKDGTEKKFKKWITEPHDEVLRLGTANTGNSGEYVIARTFTANTTAYSAGAGARGALGLPVHVGTCAVDPSFVSLRSELWVEGYGYAYAMDTGSAVKGNVVDLYMSSTGQCIQWGRRNKLAYVIQPAG